MVGPVICPFSNNSSMHTEFSVIFPPEWNRILDYLMTLFQQQTLRGIER
jgi:hypothetical protein